MRKSPPSVTYVLTHLAYGGAETQVVELCRHVKELGWRPSILSLMRPSGLLERLADIGVPVVHLDIRRGSWTPRIVTGLRREVTRLAPTVLHSHTLPANFAARVIRPMTQVPVLVTSAHNIWEGGALRMLFYRLTDRLTDLTTNCSTAAVDRYVDIKAAPASRIRYMPNGIDIDRFAPDPERRQAARSQLGLGDAFVYLAVGRMTEQKDWPNLLDAAARALGPNDRLLVVGEGELRNEVARGIVERRLGDRVQMLGTRTDIDDLMRAADVYVMSSAWEGLPIVLLEASAAGLPIIATNVGGNDQIVQPGVTGWLVPAQSANALAQAMMQVRQTPAARRAAMGQQARHHVATTYSMAAIAKTWVALYEDLLAKRATDPWSWHAPRVALEASR
ncbi:MAG: glycosyltransferase [Myxococcota bacterium]